MQIEFGCVAFDVVHVDWTRQGTAIFQAQDQLNASTKSIFPAVNAWSINGRGKYINNVYQAASDRNKPQLTDANDKE